MNNTIYGEIADHLTARASRERLEAAHGQELKPLFVAACTALAGKVPDKAELFRALQNEAENYPNFPIVTMLKWLAKDYGHALDGETMAAVGEALAAARKG